MQNQQPGWMRSKLVALALAAGLVALTATARGQAQQDVEAPRTILSADFETSGAETIVAPAQLDTALITTDPNEVVAGKRSLKGDSRSSHGEWNEFFHSKPGLFAPHQAYLVAFDYRVLARQPDAKFYALFRHGGSSQGWKEWQGASGARGHVELPLVTYGVADYYLIVGIQYQGALAIDNIEIRTDPQNRPLDARLPAPKRTWKSPGHRDYFVDSLHGNDANSGLSAEASWQSLDHINVGEFAPGDRILLRAGSSWTGFLSPGGSGASGAPIVIDRYDTGPKPRINAAGNYLAAVYLRNTEYWKIADLDIANTCRVRQPGLVGMEISEHDYGIAHQIVLRDLDIHDVSGSLVKSEGGGNGIVCINGGNEVKSLFDGLSIDGCHLTRTDRNGITMSGYGWRQDWHPSLHVVIQNNLLEDIGGDGIVPIGCDGALIAHNLLRGGRQRCDDYAAGIWPWSCDNTVVQYNEVSGMKGTLDGEGYDSDWNCSHTLFQYNYSHDNDGGFMLICNDGDVKMPRSLGNVGTVIRYNISQNDGDHTFNITGPCRDTEIYNNVFYIGKGQDVLAVATGNWGGDWSENTRFYNNIWYVAGRARFDLGGMRQTVFDHNAYWGALQNTPTDRNAITTDPLIAKPGSGSSGFPSLEGYRLLPGSPCIRAGISIADNGRRDFMGRPVPASAPPDIGATQAAEAAN